MTEALTDALEWGWLLAALVGLSLSWRELREARIDRRYLERNGLNGPRRLVAHAAIRREGLRLLTLGAFALVGTLLVAQPWLEATPLSGGFLRLVIRAVAGGAVLHIVLVTLLDRRDRQTLLRELEC
jgi:hypothetical protein